MRHYLHKLPKHVLALVKKIGTEADQRKMPTFLIGGTVRDCILNRSNEDLDIVVEGNAVVLAQSIAKKMRGQIKRYKDFSTATIVISKTARIDFATARKETYARPGALPSVRPGKIEDDLYRRDFTVNALALSINAGRFGQLVDKFDGLRDIRKKVIRVLHNKSFLDDPTRILRAIRFEQRFGFRFDRQTQSLLQTALRQRYDRYVKPPRYFAEFKKFFNERDPIRCLKRLFELKGMLFLGTGLKPNFNRLQHIDKNLLAEKDDAFKGLSETTWILYFLALLEDLEVKTIKHILNRFQFTKQDQACMLSSTGVKSLLDELSTKNLSLSQIYHLLNPFDLRLVYYLHLRTSSVVIKKRIAYFLKTSRFVTLQITGKDLRNIGIPSGKQMGDILENMLQLKIDKQIHTKREEIIFAKRIGAIK